MLRWRGVASLVQDGGIAVAPLSLGGSRKKGRFRQRGGPPFHVGRTSRPVFSIS